MYNPGTGTAPKEQPQGPSPLTNMYNLYNSTVGTQAQDYSGIMGHYGDLFNKAQSGPIGGTYNPTLSPYAQSPDETKAIGNLADLSKTGGYSDQGIADLRARGVSPIRSIYANANRDINRQRGLAGGYSPNFNALKAKMAREQSEQTAGAIQNVNAGIAQNVAGNRLQIAPSYERATAGQSDLSNQMGLTNAGIQNDASKFNIGNQYQTYDEALKALQGATSLYGTTPALSALFGSQAMGAAGLQNTINQQGNQGNVSLIGQAIQGMR